MLKPMMAVTLFASLLLTSPAAAAPEEVMTVLLPKSAPAEIHIKRPGGADSAACLTFDLKGLPESALEGKGLKVDLRLVGFRSPDQRFPQIVQVFKGCNPPTTASPIGGWRLRGRSDVEEGVLESSLAKEADNNRVGLAGTVKGAIGGELQLLIRAGDDETDWKYASLETSYGLENGKLKAYNFNDDKFRSSTRPRLILRYPAPTRQTRDPRAFGRPRTGMEDLQSFTGIVSGPLPYQDNLILIARTSSSAAEVVAFEPYGTILWKCPIQGRIGQSGVAIASQLREHSVIDGQGRLYNFGTGAVTIYDLARAADGFPTSQIANPSGVVPQGAPVISPGGNLYLIAEGQENYLYCLAPASLQELWRSEKRAGTQIKQIAVAADMVYGLTPALLRLNAATGKALDSLEGWEVDSGWKPYRPLVSPRPEGDYLVLAATGADHGLVKAFSGTAEAWKREGPVAAQPTLDKDASAAAVLTIQDQRFIRLRLDNGTEICASQREPRLACSNQNLTQCTSNLVVDGDGTAFFLNNGRMYAYNSQCRQVLALDAGQQNELLYASDHSLITRSDKTISALRDTNWTPPLRFHDQGDGTVRDRLTGLIWLKDAGCLGDKFSMGDVDAGRVKCQDYRPGSHTGWREPTIAEWGTVIKTGCVPAIGDAKGTGCYSPGNSPFVGVKAHQYWASDKRQYEGDTWVIWMNLKTGRGGSGIVYNMSAYRSNYLWPVRDPE